MSVFGAVTEVFNLDDGSTKIIFSEKGNYAIKKPSVSAGYGKWYARNATGTELSFSYDTEPVAYFPRREVGFVGGAFTEGNYTWHQIKRIHGFAQIQVGFYKHLIK